MISEENLKALKLARKHYFIEWIFTSLGLKRRYYTHNGLCHYFDRIQKNGDMYNEVGIYEEFLPFIPQATHFGQSHWYPEGAILPRLKLLNKIINSNKN